MPFTIHLGIPEMEMLWNELSYLRRVQALSTRTVRVF
jgi:hypothetical protein